MTTLTRTARRSSSCPGPDTTEATVMHTNRTRSGGSAVPADHPARKVTVAAARRQMQAALSWLDRDESITGVRRAQTMTTRAGETLELLVARLADQDAEANRRAARAQARHLRDARGRKRSPITMPGYHKGRVAPNKGQTYPATPPTINDTLKMLAFAPSANKVVRGTCPSCYAQGRHRDNDIGRVLPPARHSTDCVNPYGERLRAAILLMWRGGFRVGCELLKLTEHDLHPDQGYVHVAHGKGDKPRDVFIDDWAWPMLEPWLAFRALYPPGPLFCVIEGPTAGSRPWQPASLRLTIHKLAALCEIRTRVAPHQWRHAMAVEQVVEGIPEIYVSRNLGHADLGVTSRYLMGLPQSRVREALKARPVPQISMMDALKNEGVQFKRNNGPTPDLMGALGAAHQRRELVAA